MFMSFALTIRVHLTVEYEINRLNCREMDELSNFISPALQTMALIIHKIILSVCLYSHPEGSADPN